MKFVRNDGNAISQKKEINLLIKRPMLEYKNEIGEILRGTLAPLIIPREQQLLITLL